VIAFFIRQETLEEECTWSPREVNDLSSPFFLFKGIETNVEI
jgi:hypothetical protein